MRIDSPNTNADPLLLSAGRAARLLGMSERALRRADQAEKVPRPVRIGRNVRWRAAELAAWVEVGCPDLATWIVIRNGGRAGKPPDG